MQAQLDGQLKDVEDFLETEEKRAKIEAKKPCGHPPIKGDPATAISDKDVSIQRHALLCVYSVNGLFCLVE